MQFFKMNFIFFKPKFFFSANSREILKFSTKYTLTTQVLKNVNEFLKMRCAGMGFVPNIRVASDEKSEEIKLFGDYLLRFDTAVWKVVKENTTFEEIYLSKEEILLLVFETLQKFDLTKEKEILKQMKKKVFSNEFQKVEDIVFYLEELKKNID